MTANEKTCTVCGKTYHRPRWANGKHENAHAWAARKACSHACRQALRRETQTGNAEARIQHLTAPTCVQCGEPVLRRAGERSHRWQERRTCSDACLEARRFKANPGGHPATLQRGREQPIVAPRRVGFERFPEPAGIRSAWVSVTGPDVGPPQGSHQRVGINRLRSPALTEAMLAALEHHPDLSTALAGALTDSWVPFNPGGVANTPGSGRYA